MKRFMASATASRKKNSQSRTSKNGISTAPQQALHRGGELDHLMDLYWGGSERRITGLTLRIIAVNAIALVILLVGILYMGQYQNNLIEAKLETFKTEIQLLSKALAEVAIKDYKTNAYNPTPKIDLNTASTFSMVETMSLSMNKRIRLFNENGDLLIDSGAIGGVSDYSPFAEAEEDSSNHPMRSIEVLKKVTFGIIGFLPDRRILPRYTTSNIQHATQSINTNDAMNGKMSFSAWINDDDRILLSAAAPIMIDGKIAGTVFMTRISKDIEDGVINVWFDIFRGFAITLCITILLSIYLSGAIARPLKKLAKAAEKIRMGNTEDMQIPDFSYRHDEIGELSIVLREMTDALRQRMNSIERFAADVSHELKNPLTSLKSAIDTLAIVKKPEDRKKLTDIIQHDIQRLDRLITDISSASRLDVELSREVFKPVDIPVLLEDILNRYRTPLERHEQLTNKLTQSDSVFSAQDPALSVQNDPAPLKTLNTPFRTTTMTSENGVHLRLNIESTDDMHVMGSETKLGQVFVNLLTNAMSFSSQGDTITIEIHRRVNAVVVSIEDEGPGIPESKLEAVFERFYSERPSHEDYGRHSGLGLSICQQIINAHQGRIFAENRKNTNGDILGARFTVILQRQ